MTRLYTMFGESRFFGKFLFDRFLVFCETGIKFPFGLPDVEFVAIFTWNGINYAACLIFWHGSLGLRNKLPIVWCGFKATLTL